MTQIAPEIIEVNNVEEKIKNLNELVLYNDDVNTFEFVIESLIEICNHDSVQAEQCAFLIHFKGKSSVKKGLFKDLEPMCVALLNKGLSAKIE